MRPSFTLGIEEEYQTIDPETRDLRSHIDMEILGKGKALLREAIKPEMHQSVIEVGTGICKNIRDAKAEVYGLRRDMIKLAKDNGLRLAAGGTRHILGQFFAANSGLTAKFYVSGGIGNTQVAGTVSAQQFDFTGAGGVPSLYQAPWNLGALPGAAGPAAGAFVSIVSSTWVQVQ